MSLYCICCQKRAVTIKLLKKNPNIHSRNFTAACSHTSHLPPRAKPRTIPTLTSLLSLTRLWLVRGRVNPLLSGTHAAPIHHGSTENARVQLCRTARSAGWEETRKWVRGQVTSFFNLGEAEEELALRRAAYLSQHSAQGQEI